MGLSAFSRARVSQLPELELEAKRFDAWNKLHQKSFRALDDHHSGEEAEEAIEEIREQTIEDAKEIGEKAVAGMAENTKEGDPIDLPLRLDHVRDLVGRRHVDDPQGKPKSTLERLHERIPTGKTASEKLVYKTSAEGPGPTKAEVDAAEEEQTAWYEETELPAAGDSAGVKGATPASPAPKAAPKPEAKK